MPWTEFEDADDVIHDWLKSLYTPYRNALPDPTVLPLEDDIDWDSFWSGAHDTSFAVLENDTQHMNLGLGVKTIKFNGMHTVRVGHRFITSQNKPPVLKRMREFLTKTLHANINPLPNVLRTDAGITQMLPTESRIVRDTPYNPQSDMWVLEVRVATVALNDVT